MAKDLQICRICLNINVTMITLKNTNMANLYNLLTEVHIDMVPGDGKPTTVCFKCYARLQECERLQHQAVKSNELLEQLLKEGFTPATANASSYIKVLKVLCPSHTDLEPANCKDVLFEPNVEVNAEAIDGECNEADVRENANDSYFASEGSHSDSEDDQPLIAIGSNKCDGIRYIAHEVNLRKQQEQENLCTPEHEVKYNPHPKDETSNINEEAKAIQIKSHRYLEILQIPTQSEDTKKEDTNGAKTSVSVITKEFQCNECSKKFSTKNFLISHILKCMKTTEASVCDSQMKKANTLKSLLPFSCNICEYRCAYKLSLKSHMRNHTGEKPFSCKVCEFRSAHKSALYKHMRKHTGEKPFSCNICDYRCAYKVSLKSHMRIHTGEKPFSCKVCDYSTAYKGNLKTHMRIHTGEKPLSCKVCNYRCSHITHLKTHLRTHTGEKPFSCNICDYSCAYKLSLKSHMGNHTGEKPFSCKVCEYSSTNKSNLKTHMRKHTGEKPFSCKVCEYSSAHRSNLKTHMAIHTDEKPFSCTVCNYRCSHIGHLKTHLRIHTGEKPFSCIICEYRSTCSSSLKRHLSTHR